MRILAVIDSFNFGGAETQLAQVLGCLSAERRHECLVCSLLSPQPLEVPFSPDIQRVYLDKTSRWSIPRVTWDLLGLLRRFKPDVVYSRLPMANGLSRLATLASIGGIRHVAGIDTVPAMYTSAYTRAHPGSYLFRWLERHASCIVCNSRGTAEAIARAGYPVDRLRVIPNGIDVERLRPMPGRQESDRLALLCIATLRPEKGVARLIDVLAPLLRTRRIELRVVGDGEERRDVERHIERLGIASTVTLLGAQTDVLPLLHQSDIYVSAAFVEGFGVAAAEAAATGLPAVAFAVPGGLSEVIIDQVTGYLIPDHAPEQFREAVQRLCDDRALRGRMGEAARSHVVHHFALSQVVAVLETCLQGH